MILEQASASDDPVTIADLIWETDPEMCKFVFGDRPTWRAYCEIEWRAAIGLHTHGAATVARSGGRTVGLVIAYPQEEMTVRYAATVARYEAEVSERMAAVGWLFPVIPEKGLYVFNLAVSQSHRGQGIGGLLLSTTEKQAQRSGMTTVHLDVPATSPAVKFYERMDYRKLTKTALLEPVTDIPPHFRMHKTIGQ
jgi:GNAT superfamily N-acetyltransferase